MADQLLGMIAEKLVFLREYHVLGSRAVMTVYDVINGIVPYLEGQMWNFEFDIND